MHNVNTKYTKLSALRIMFFGTSSFAAAHLYTLVHFSRHNIIAIFTQEIKPQKQKPYLSLYDIAKKNNILYFQSNTLSIPDIIKIIKTFNIDLIIVVSYGLIFSQEILSIPKLGCINVHASLLPRWRGPAPIQRALEYGDSTTGISIIQMNTKIDTGDILYSIPCKILPKDTSYTLSKKLANIGSTMLLQVLERITSGSCNLTPQKLTETTYAHKLNKQEARINWKLSAIQLERCIRAFNPWPISYFQVKTHRIRVWKAEVDYQNKIHRSLSSSTLMIKSPGTISAIDSHGIHVVTGSGILILITLQIPGKKITPVRDLLNAYQKWFSPNSILE